MPASFRSDGAEDLRWASVSDLAEYAYCPRAWWYQDHPPVESPDPSTVRRLERGVAFHAHELSRVRRRDSWGAYPAILAVALGLAVLALLLIGSS